MFYVVSVTGEVPLYGLDGCPGGWVVACSSAELASVTFSVIAERELKAFLRPLAGTAAVIAIDVPIGLADGDARACDRAARVRLGAPRCSSVFSAPCRDSLAATDYLHACAINRALRGRALSRQCWGIMTKIAVVEALLDELPDLADQIWEVHPEVTFAELAASPCGIGPRKKSPAGQRERLAVLAAHGLPVDLEHVRRELRAPEVARDDIVDAAGCLLTAARIARQQAVFLPRGQPPLDRRGRRMQIAA